MDELTLSVVGIDFPSADRSKSNRRMELLLCAPGEPVDLRREPKNPHDANAVAVFSARGIQMGYISAERAPLIGRRMQQEEHVAVFQALTGSMGYVRIRFGGGAPSLPDVVAGEIGARSRGRAAPFDSDAFYPDPEGPEWGA
ncbi:HIRAN domain-containing protein [Sphingomonas sp. PP-CE-3A-406]|uniref:HIRAN domain-containing protein n=1 Tax=Sphingomonas sp. PP-CE-3A-406 TaxID=2135659 RepID=UPI000EF9DB9C|nr:HIRAN domain-containing protein [Sphingomonas sp. PP-CE-3A-406]RMB53864.1 HIRAN domain-containing protein [Sphingomonas sp. PP-CE-3A-406]